MILRLIDSAERREPTCVRSGAMAPPVPFSLWQPRHPAALMIAVGSVLPPAKAPPGLAPGVSGAAAGMSLPVTSTVPPFDSRKAITAQICDGESWRVITGMIGW